MPIIWFICDHYEYMRLTALDFLPSYNCQMFQSASELLAALERSRPEQHPTMIISTYEALSSHLRAADQRADTPFPQSIPYFVIANESSDVDLDLCLRCGVSDFVLRPLGPREFRVRLERVLSKRRIKMEPLSQLEFDTDSLSMRRGGKRGNPLTSREFTILRSLQKMDGRPLSRDHLLRAVWGNTVVTAKTIDVHIFNCCKKLAPLGVTIQFIGPDSYCLKTIDHTDSRTVSR